MANRALLSTVGAAAAALLILSPPARAGGAPPGLPLFQAVTTGLTAHWPMDTVGATTPDVVAANDFTGVNGPVAATGVFGGAVRLDGTDDHMTAADAAALNFGTGDFTVAAWIYPANTSSLRLINKWDGPAQQGWLLDVHSTTGGGGQVGALRVRLDGSASSNAAADNLDYTAAGVLGSGAWQHVAFTVDRTAGMLTLYVDGASVGSTAIAGTIGSLSNTFALGLGTIPTSAGKYFNGDVDEVRFYDRALSGPEIQTLVAPAPPTGLAATGNSVPTASIDLTWTASSGATGYQVYRGTAPGGPYAALGASTTFTSYSDTTVAYGTTYYYVVVALGPILDSGNSAEASATAVPPVPRTNDHEEGLIDGKCACGTASPAGAGTPLLLAGLALLAALARRR